MKTQRKSMLKMVAISIDPLDVPGLYEELQRRRGDLGDAAREQSDFVVCLVGGKRSHERLGVAVEALKGQVVKTGDAERFCRLYRLQMLLLS